MTLTIGVTGGIGAGKTTVARCFGAHDIAWMDADQAARDIVRPGEAALEEICTAFGHQMLDASGELNRRALRALVFDDAEARRQLEAITHPRIREHLVTFLETPKSSAYQLLVSPLLLETSQKALADRILVIDVPSEVQVSRTTARDQTDEAQVKAIMAAQLSRQERLALADDVIDNQRDIHHLRRQVAALHKQYLTLAGASS
ncbi:dephospho-CoA kinase [Larsenimonas rhizosphaerae]|uniref:Dephospho-CoA kinase n=1 Tax=Larsenimonas rhizosphaerae TaxID=2944682 RepID=A0AA41ZKL4_9GAMM|nr:dephospho-CoA kinase [Larsenimonas rhizosphaerae]MCX2523736.1 dephospho-CoA kinase [Larsenimonas rhizosphaerae]